MGSNITLTSQCKTVKLNVKFTTFSDGCENCKIEGINKHIDMVFDIKVGRVLDGQRDIFRILLVNEAILRSYCHVGGLYIPYLPNARADRLFEEGNSHPLKVTCQLINSCNFSSVTIQDPHSDVAEGLLNNVRCIPQKNNFYYNSAKICRLLGCSEYTLCAPDLGATKKTFDLVMGLPNKSDYYQALKVRDVSTGDIVKCDLVEKEVSGNVVIVDDISDGGASFIYLAKLLKERGADKVLLYVTHGIFSKGLNPLKEYVDYIVCDNIVGSYISNDDLLEYNN